jgi:hypothetical protein
MAISHILAQSFSPNLSQDGQLVGQLKEAG